MMGCAFVAGMAVNEYRHGLGAASDAIHSAINIDGTTDVRPQHAQVLTAPSTTDPSTTAPAILEPDAAPHAELFSWARIQQLLAVNDVAAAERLLQAYVKMHSGSAQAWLYLAQIYQQQHKPTLALEAWFRYLDVEVDVSLREQALSQIKAYLVALYQDKLFQLPNGAGPSWLIAQLDTLVKSTADDGALHLMLADLQLQAGDEYQAQYHALMAANDPAVQSQAEAILSKLGGGAEVTDEVAIPLAHFGDQYLVAVSINGNNAKLLLDTGASISGVSTQFIAKYPYIVGATKPIQLNTASGVVESYLFGVDSLAMGSLLFQRHMLARLPMGDMTQFDGLLGIDILGRYDFVIDRDAMLLRLTARNK